MVSHLGTSSLETRRCLEQSELENIVCNVILQKTKAQSPECKLIIIQIATMKWRT